MVKSCKSFYQGDKGYEDGKNNGSRNLSSVLKYDNFYGQRRSGERRGRDKVILG